MNNRDYWRIRTEQDQLKLLKPFENLVESQLKLYDKTLQEIKKDIDYYVKRFANNNGIFDYYEASKLLQGNDLKEFKMSLKEYTKFAKDKELSKKYIKELENVSLKVRFTRLQALELEIRNKIELLYSENELNMTEELKNLILENQNRLIYNMSTKYKNLVSFTKIDDSLVDKLLKNSWTVDEKNFSDRLWQNKTKLINVLKNELKSAIIRGEANSNNTFNLLKQKLNTDYNSVRKIVLTESAYFSERAKCGLTKIMS